MGDPSTAIVTARAYYKYAHWADLVSFRPSKAIQDGLQSRNSEWAFHRLEDAVGAINLDLYPVFVSSLPTIGNAVTTPGGFLEHIRRYITRFVDQRLAQFNPYFPEHDADRKDDDVKWNSSSPLGTVISIDMNMLATWLNPDDGSVVCSEHQSSRWRFSTIFTDEDHSHPVSGTREFGFWESGDPNQPGWTYYVRGADRKTQAMDRVAPVFTFADLLWRSFQSKVNDFVRANGGTAKVYAPKRHEADWGDVQKHIWKPTEDWHYPGK